MLFIIHMKLSLQFFFFFKNSRLFWESEWPNLKIFLLESIVHCDVFIIISKLHFIFKDIKIIFLFLVPWKLDYFDYLIFLKIFFKFIYIFFDFWFCLFWMPLEFYAFNFVFVFTNCSCFLLLFLTSILRWVSWSSFCIL